MDKVIAEQTDVLDAMFRPDVGSISFYWGTPGKGPRFKGGSGVSHLIAHRNAQGLDGETIARKMPEVLAYGEISKRQGAQGGDRVFITLGEHTAVLSLYRFGKRETWLLTGWINENTPDAQAEVYDSASATSSEPTRFQFGDGAGVTENSISPLGVDGKPLFQSQHASRAGAENKARGAIIFRPEDGQALIALFKGKRDMSTILHETGHYWLENLRRVCPAGRKNSSSPAGRLACWGLPLPSVLAGVWLLCHSLGNSNTKHGRLWAGSSPAFQFALIHNAGEKNENPKDGAKVRQRAFVVWAFLLLEGNAETVGCRVDRGRQRA